VVTIVTSVVVPHTALASWLRRVLFAGSIPLLFSLSGAVGSTFYPQTPDSFSQFLQLLCAALVEQIRSC